jgi:hypothetical protein
MLGHATSCLWSVAKVVIHSPGIWFCSLWRGMKSGILQCLYLFVYSFFLFFFNLCLFDCRILSTPKARQVLVNSAVRKGERLIPPSAFEILIRVTFPASSAKMKVVTLGTFTMSEVRCIMITCCIVS